LSERKEKTFIKRCGIYLNKKIHSLIKEAIFKRLNSLSDKKFWEELVTVPLQVIVTMH
jgi:hypothetical protein